jgi:hypothetical protein
LPRLAATLLTLVVIAGSSVAFAVSERLKLERAPVTAPLFTRQFSPVCRCPQDAAVLRIRFRRPETVDATIVDARGAAVRSLAEREKVPSGAHVFRWDGRDDAGSVVRDGKYRLRLEFRRERRAILVPTTIRVDTRPPRIRTAGFRPPAFSPDGDGHADRVRIVYRASEKARATLFVDGRRAVRTGYLTPKRRHGVQWRGGFPPAEPGGELERARPGEYRLRLVVHDLAGNAAAVTGTVRLRYVELDRSAYGAAPGGTLRFSVDTDAPTFRWYLYRPHDGVLGRAVLHDAHASPPDVAVSLPAAARPGTYLLRVEVGKHRARAFVAVSSR